MSTIKLRLPDRISSILVREVGNIDDCFEGFGGNKRISNNVQKTENLRENNGDLDGEVRDLFGGSL
jgi:hypothetical protein